MLVPKPANDGQMSSRSVQRRTPETHAALPAVANPPTPPLERARISVPRSLLRLPRPPLHAPLLPPLPIRPPLIRWYRPLEDASASSPRLLPPLPTRHRSLIRLRGPKHTTRRNTPTVQVCPWRFRPPGLPARLSLPWAL